jgi:hypothetical protein
MENNATQKYHSVALMLKDKLRSKNGPWSPLFAVCALRNNKTIKMITKIYSQENNENNEKTKTKRKRKQTHTEQHEHFEKEDEQEREIRL